MRPLLILAALLATAIALVVSGCGSAATAPLPLVQDDRHRRYHDGVRWIEVTVALDRLHLERTIAGGDQRSVEVYLLRMPVGSVAALDDVARQMLAAQKDIHSISAYVSTSDAAGAQPMRLTHRFALRGKPGQDLDRLASRYGARVVEHVDYSPDTVICLALAPGLLVALEAADAAQQDPDVESATPLIDRGFIQRLGR